MMIEMTMPPTLFPFVILVAYTFHGVNRSGSFVLVLFCHFKNTPVLSFIFLSIILHNIPIAVN